MNKGGRAALARSKSIDHQIDEDSKRRQREVQLLILGGAGSGKSTFIKQLQLHYGDKFSDPVRLQYVKHILHNITCALRVILLQMDVMDMQYDTAENRTLASEFCQKHPPLSLEAVLACIKEEDERLEKALQARGDMLMRRRLTPQDVLTPQVPDLDMLMTLWTDCGVQCCYARRQKFDWSVLSRSAEYFLENLDRMIAPDYMPTDQDILYIRWPTLGMQEHSFSVENLEFKVIDVAGQKSLRKKWIHFFESVTAVLFFVALSGYDETLEEDPGMNTMQDSLQAFHEVSHNHFLEKTDFILFLNKKDVFIEHIKTVSLTHCFPDYKGCESPESCLRYIKEQFLQNKPGHKQLYIHLITAVDIPGMRHILANVMDIIMEINLRRIQLH